MIKLLQCKQLYSRFQLTFHCNIPNFVHSLRSSEHNSEKLTEIDCKIEIRSLSQSALQINDNGI